MSAKYKLTDDEFVAALRAKLPTGSLARPILELFHEDDGSIARARTLEWFGSFVSVEECNELMATAACPEQIRKKSG